jgi:hypothetical protein
MRRGLLSLPMIVMVIASCGSAPTATPTATPSRTLGAGERWLPVANFGSNGLCAGGGTVGDFRLRGAADDPRLAWMIWPDGRRTELAWPVGYSARFTPNLEVLDDHGQRVAVEGSLVTGGCGILDTGVTLPEFTTPAP